MKRGRKIVTFMLWVIACGDNGSTTTATSTSPTTTPATSASSAHTTGEDTGSTESATTGHTSSGASTQPTDPTTTSSEDGGPVFLSLGASDSTLTEGESVTFTALLTDPDGVEDIIGGSLLSEDEAIDYGAFVATPQDGSYSISLTWAQIHQADAIEFEGGGIARVFHARFFDQAQHKAVRSVELTLSCLGGASCNGACTDLSSDGANCGSCGHACASQCEAGECAPTWSPCFTSNDGFNTCAEVCQSLGESCAEAACDGGITTKFYQLPKDCADDLNSGASMDPCDTQQTWANSSIKCCCTGSN